MQSITDFDANIAHHNMIEKQIREQFMLDSTILGAISQIPRHDFVPLAYKSLAYADMKIPLNHNEFMMTPNEEARMLASLEIKPSDKVLEIGTGTGYVTALLAELSHSVISLDIYQDFIQQANEKLKQYKLFNVKLFEANGVNGYKASQPFDVICITGGLHYINQSLLDQVHSEGRVFAIIGERPSMTATVFKRSKNNQWQSTQLFETEINYLKNIPTPSAFKF